MSNAPSICLAMMVKNEEKALPATLQAIKPFISRWLIIDTGSTDNTKSVVCSELSGVPGNLVEKPWVNWEHNRNETIESAKLCGCDFIFLLNADEVVHDLVIPELDSDNSYWIEVHYAGIVFSRPNLISVKQDWHYVGVTHEYLTCSGNLPRVKLQGYLNTDRIKGKETFLEDVRILEEALKKEPDNARYVFYLAQSYKDSDQPEKAIEWYGKRADMGGWAEEVYISLLRVAQLMEGRRTFPEVAIAYIRAQEYRRERAGETLSNFARYCKWWADGTAYPKDDILFVDPSCYRIGR